MTSHDFQTLSMYKHHNSTLPKKSYNDITLIDGKGWS